MSARMGPDRAGLLSWTEQRTKSFALHFPEASIQPEWNDKHSFGPRLTDLLANDPTRVFFCQLVLPYWIDFSRIAFEVNSITGKSQILWSDQLWQTIRVTSDACSHLRVRTLVQEAGDSERIAEHKTPGSTPRPSDTTTFLKRSCQSEIGAAGTRIIHQHVARSPLTGRNEDQRAFITIQTGPNWGKGPRVTIHRGRQAHPELCRVK